MYFRADSVVNDLDMVVKQSEILWTYLFLNFTRALDEPGIIWKGIGSEMHSSI
jgi:hypothetical protein